TSGSVNDSKLLFLETETYLRRDHKPCSRGGDMTARRTAVALAALTLAIIPITASRAAPRHSGSGSRLCTWGGTPAAPTGRLSISPGATNTPSTGPERVYATGELVGGGPCTGTMTFHGIAQPGGTCAAAIFDGRVQGVPGLATFHGA